MESRRAAGLLIAVMTAILIVLAGRSCAKDIQKDNKRNSKSEAKPTAAVQAEPATSWADSGYQDAPQPPQTPQTPMDEPDPTAPSEQTSSQEDASDPEQETREEEEVSTKSKLDEIWDSEHPSYLDPYGFLNGDDDGGLVDGGNNGGGSNNYQGTIHIEIG